MAGFTINNVTISGNLTRDPELRTLPNSDTSVCSVSIAVNERTKNRQTGDWEDRPNYFDVTIWKGLGEYIARELRKGDGLAVEGRLRWRSWEKDGQKRSAVDIIASSVVPMPRNGGGGGSGGGGGQREQQPVAADSGGFDRPLPGADDDIPF